MMNNAYFLNLKNNFLDNIGWSCFQLGVFCLPSSAFISYLFLFVALVNGSITRRDLYWREYWNYPLVLVTFLMLIGCIRSHTGSLAWFGLFNWVGLEVRTVKWGYCMVWKSKERSNSSLDCLFQTE